MVFTPAQAQNAAVSSYLNPNDNFPGDIRIKEVRVPQAGYAVNTYYCVLGWSGSVAGASGYGGIQYSSAGGNNYIYSIWNDSVKAAYLDPNMIFRTFGGEGTGYQSITYAYPWTPGYWNVLADRAWDVGNNTHTAFFVKDGKTGVWRHLITIRIPIAHERYTGQSYNFLEDWAGNGLYRQSQIRRGWKRRDANKSWFPISQENYSINVGDLSNRSLNKSTNWQGGTGSDSSGSYFYMAAGGSISSTNNSGTNYAIAQTAQTPQEYYGVARIAKLSSVVSGDKSKLVVSWINDSLTVPQYASRVTINDGAAVVAMVADTVPQRRGDTLDISGLTPATKAYTVTLAVTDMFDGQAVSVTAPLGSSVVTRVASKNPGVIRLNLVGSRLFLNGVPNPRVDVVKVSGKVFKSIQFSGDREHVLELNGLGLSPGVYFAAVMWNGNNKILRFVSP